MTRPKTTSPAALLDQIEGEASWLLSHAEALTAYGRQEEAAAEYARAAACEEQVACLLEADGQKLEAAVHRVSAAACLEKLGQHIRAVTLLHAALSGPLHDNFRARVEQYLKRNLKRVQKELRQTASHKSHKHTPAIS